MIQTISKKGKEYVLVPKDEYEQLVSSQLSDLEADLPPLPERLPSGNYPAVEYARAVLARDIICTRRRLGLSQAELARRAGIRIETLNRIEKGRTSTTVRTVEKLDQAIKAAEAASKQPQAKAKPHCSTRKSPRTLAR